MVLVCTAVLIAAAVGSALPARAVTQAASATPPATPVRPHAAFDQTTLPAPQGVTPGAKAQPLLHPKVAMTSFHAAAAAPSGAASPAPPDPEVLGFAQVGEVTSGSWTSDLRFNLLSTVAYFGVNVNSDGTLNTGDSGYSGWRSAQLTNLMNAAHAAGDRVVLTIKAFNDPAISGSTGSETARQTLISAVVGELRARGGDGVNVDFEGVSSSLASNFTTFVGELNDALKAQVPDQAYLTVDTYASAGQGGTMYDLAALTPHLDAFDLMGYGFESGGEASPTAPMHGWWYNVTQSVTDYQTKYGVPPQKLILGVPYYGYKWSVGTRTPGGDGVQPGSNASADTYAGALSDFSCALDLTQFWDSTFEEPYATWWSPASGDPCGGNHNSARELYYDDANALGAKYDLVNADGLRGIGIWALGYDSGSSALWNEIALKFSVTHAPSATVQALPGTESSTAFTVSWTNNPGSPQPAYYSLWAQDGSGPWSRYTNTTATSITAYGFPGHTYSFYVEAIAGNGYDSGGPAGSGQASTTVSSSASRAITAFTSLYAVGATGCVQPGSSPPLAPSCGFGSWDIVRGIALDSSGQGGALIDAWGGAHSFGDTTSVNAPSYWAGWYVITAVAANASNQGYVLDAFGGVHPFSLNGAALPADAATYAYWPNWSVARGVALFSDGTGGVVLDAFGGVHPFTVPGDAAQPEQPTDYPYWPGWGIARDVVLLPGSTYTHYAGYVLDGWGGIHPFGGAPSVSGGAWWQGWDVARRLVLIPGSSTSGYVVDAFGGFHPFGGAPAVQTYLYTPGLDTARGLAIR